MTRNYQEKLSTEIITGNYKSGEIMTRNYQLVYYVAENVGIIGILAYPKNYLHFYVKISIAQFSSVKRITFLREKICTFLYSIIFNSMTILFIFLEMV